MNHICTPSSADLAWHPAAPLKESQGATRCSSTLSITEAEVPSIHVNTSGAHGSVLGDGKQIITTPILMDLKPFSSFQVLEDLRQPNYDFLPGSHSLPPERMAVQTSSIQSVSTVLFQDCL